MDVFVANNIENVNINLLSLVLLIDTHVRFSQL